MTLNDGDYAIVCAWRSTLKQILSEDWYEAWKEESFIDKEKNHVWPVKVPSDQLFAILHSMRNKFYEQDCPIGPKGENDMIAYIYLVNGNKKLHNIATMDLTITAASSEAIPSASS